MGNITFKQFLQEFDRSDLALQKQVADKKAAQHEFSQKGQEIHDHTKQQAPSAGKVEIQTGDMVLANQTLFKIKDHKPAKQGGAWKIPVRNMKSGQDTWFDYNNFKTGKLADTGKKHENLYRILSWTK